MSTNPTARHKAIDYLARREHSYLELFRKLSQKGYAQSEIEQVLAQLIDDNLLSDSRFAEAFVRSRVAKGYGPARIRMELKEKGLDDCQVDQAFEVNNIDWDSVIESVWLKKYSDSSSFVDIDKNRQWRFLQYRGFTHSQISQLFRRIDQQIENAEHS